jgi:outer membrane lipoprotein-sorting protein
MHTSARRWRTIRASGSEWRHPVRSRRAWERLLPRRGSRSVAIYGSTGERIEPEDVREPWRLWLHQPDRVRAEFMGEDETVTAVIVGDRWWSWSASREVTTNQGDPHHSHGRGPGEALIDASSILPAVELDLVGTATFIGRPVFEVIATPSPIDEDNEESSDWLHAAHDLGGGADEFALMVDAERGVLLRSEARIEGEPFRILEMEAVAFDEDFENDVFAPPAGRGIETAGVPRSVELAELPDAVPFTVLVPEHPPFGVDYVDVHPADHRHGRSEQVHITFGSNWFGEEDRRFSLIESAEPLPAQESMDWQNAGTVHFGEDRDIDPPLRRVQLERMGTHVEVRSHSLGIEELLDLARSLVPLAGEPPSLSATPTNDD